MYLLPWECATARHGILCSKMVPPNVTNVPPLSVVLLSRDVTFLLMQVLSTNSFHISHFDVLAIVVVLIVFIC